MIANGCGGMGDAMPVAMRSMLFDVTCTLAATAAFWTVFGACVDAPVDAEAHAPLARLVASWDPLACNDPHRVVLELEDDAGLKRTASSHCELGGLMLVTSHFGIYRGRIYRVHDDGPIEISMEAVAVQIAIDAPIVRWEIAQPP